MLEVVSLLLAREQIQKMRIETMQLSTRLADTLPLSLTSEIVFHSIVFRGAHEKIVARGTSSSLFSQRLRRRRRIIRGWRHYRDARSFTIAHANTDADPYPHAYSYADPHSYSYADPYSHPPSLFGSDPCRWQLVDRAGEPRAYRLCREQLLGCQLC